MVVVALTSVARPYPADCALVDWKLAGLPKETKAKGVVRTMEQNLIYHQYGKLTTRDLERLRDSVRGILDL